MDSGLQCPVESKFESGTGIRGKVSGEFVYFDESVYGEDYEFGLGFRVDLQVEVDEFLLFDIVGLHVLEDVWEETRDVLADRHTRDDSFDRFFARVPVLRVQVCA